jgi:hypothetical protein
MAPTVDVLVRNEIRALRAFKRLELRVNNNVSPSLARVYVLRHPVASDFFEFRGIRSPGAALGVAEAVAA